MILHTIVPDEVIFEGDGSKKEYNYKEIVLNGITMQVEMVGEQQARIVRIYSGNPSDFLNPMYAPGTIIQYRPFV